MRSVELLGVEKRFGDVTALDGVDLLVEAGESMVVLGPSGCGKSTTLRLLAGLEDPTAGDVQLGGVSQLGRLPHERDVAIVFQNFALYPHLSAAQNIGMGLRHGLKLDKETVRARVHEVAKRMEIEDLLDRLPRAMSGGQRQRVSLARALAREAGLVLLDEPLSGLDAQLRAALRVEMAGLLRDTGATVLHVTHDQVDAMALADRVAVMREGRIEQVATPVEIYQVPNSVFVATFVGSPPMNLLEASISAGQIHVEGIGIIASARAADGGASVGFRPEHARFGQGEIGMRGAVRAVELAGNEWLVYIDIQGGTIAIRHRGVPPKPTEIVGVAVDLEECHLFDAAGERVDVELVATQKTCG